MPAPRAVGSYNRFMQAVDRHDQLRQLFSLSSRHGFKKYYIKIMLGIIDMVLVNSFILFKMTNEEKCQSRSARYDFMDSIAEALMSNDWENFSISNTGNTNDAIFEQLVNDKAVAEDETTAEQTDLVLDKNSACAGCTPNSVTGLWQKRSKYKKFACQICRFEGRGENIVQGVCWCSKHGIRCCSVARSHKPLKKIDGTPMTDYSWRLGDDGMTCWDKAHSFYIPNGLFDDIQVVQHDLGQPKFQNARLGSMLYQKKRLAEGRDAIMRRKRKAADPHSQSGETSAAVRSNKTAQGKSKSKRKTTPVRRSTRVKQKRQTRPRKSKRITHQGAK